MYGILHVHYGLHFVLALSEDVLEPADVVMKPPCRRQSCLLGEELVAGDDQLGLGLLQAVHHRLLPQVRVQGHHRETTLETRLDRETRLYLRSREILTRVLSRHFLLFGWA